MLISQGTARNERINLKLACSLAAIAGALNAAAFYAVGYFSANMTGNISALSDHLATGQWSQGLFFLFVFLAFILGATLASLLINFGNRRGVHGIYAYSILTEAVLLAALAVADLRLATSWRVSVLVLGLAFLMGLQNATVTRISEARVRTTHISGMATDLGIELGIAIDILRSREADAQGAENRAKLKLHLFTIVAFLLGGVLGVLSYQAVGGYLLLACAVLLFLVAVMGLRHSQTASTKSPIHRDRWRPPQRRS